MHYFSPLSQDGTTVNVKRWDPYASLLQDGYVSDTSTGWPPPPGGTATVPVDFITVMPCENDDGQPWPAGPPSPAVPDPSLILVQWLSPRVARTARRASPPAKPTGDSPLRRRARLLEIDD